MSNPKKQWGAIIIMIALFAMIAFVTNLCSPMAIIVKNDFGASNVLAQIGNIGNFIAYLVMGIPAGMLISKFGYKKTALIGLAIGIVGILIQWLSGHVGKESAFLVYLIGAFISGFTMCILNCVVNPMLNILGGGGNKGNQLIQIGGVFNSSAAVAVYIIMGALIGDATKAHIADATPALMIALAIFVIAAIVIFFTKIEEPEQAPIDITLIKGAMKYRHFMLGTLAIFLYMGIEVGTPTYILQYLTSAPDAATPGRGMDANIVGLIVAVYWLMMLVGRFVGGSIGGKVSSRTMITTVSSVSILLVIFGMFAPADVTVNVPGIDWANISVIWAEVPMGIFAFLLVGLCTSVMWGGIFNMAVEGLGKYTAIASGIFMTMVFGCAVMVPLQGWIADITGNYMSSYWVVVFCSAYVLFYALVGSKVSDGKK
ncbi:MULTISPECIES: MFS transporter [Bacteroides]|jgi:FHS family L-fucose permease-like MFS transporter|uniref:MFS transporter n=5 Tax=Bacteroidales TaxID=171549 RepID=A0A9X2NS52_9BACE|nr:MULTISPECIES: MFS transporter [Bacteroides]MCR6503827.1 MFS transporter [Bacteroides muris (ex Fokt et al. 2023)]MCR6507350.1 MFS transporter [Bacteroides muris (ex Fokt et al. 2023)]NVK92371.1 MFS transporter [Bacteroides sp. L10-4]TGY08562.1 MFS transporter [Bacteroides muris (ex Afrizal et al. 2022)]